MTLDPGQERGYDVVPREKSLYSPKKRSSTGYFLIFRSEVDAIARVFEHGEITQGDAEFDYERARERLVENLDATFASRLVALARKANTAQAGADTDPPSALPG